MDLTFRFQMNGAIAPGVMVRDVTVYMKRMLSYGGLNYFEDMKIEMGRSIFTIGRGREYDPDEGPICFSRTLTCFAYDQNRSQTLNWQLTVNFRGDAGNFNIDSHEEGSEGVDENYIPEMQLYDISLHTTWIDEDIISVELASNASRPEFESDIYKFAAEFKRLEHGISNLNHWVTGGLKAAIACRCGNISVLKFANVVSKKTNNLFDLKRRLRCRACGEMGYAEILPIYADPTEYHCGRTDKYFGKNKIHYDSFRQGDEEIGLYDVLGGDGISSVYVGDGNQIGPDGEFNSD